MQHSTSADRDPIRCAILTISDRAARGAYQDRTGPEVAARVRGLGWRVVAAETLPDEEDLILARLSALADSGAADLILTAGGTGLGPRDRTPEATARAAERIVPGIPEAMRARTGAAFPPAYLSRGIAVLRGRTLIINLPGSVRGATDCLGSVADILPHALAVVGEDVSTDRSHPGQDP